MRIQRNRGQARPTTHLACLEHLHPGTRFPIELFSINPAIHRSHHRIKTRSRVRSEVVVIAVRYHRRLQSHSVSAMGRRSAVRRSMNITQPRTRLICHIPRQSTLLSSLRSRINFHQQGIHRIPIELPAHEQRPRLSAHVTAPFMATTDFGNASVFSMYPGARLPQLCTRSGDRGTSKFYRLASSVLVIILLQQMLVTDVTLHQTLISQRERGVTKPFHKMG